MDTNFQVVLITLIFWLELRFCYKKNSVSAHKKTMKYALTVAKLPSFKIMYLKLTCSMENNSDLFNIIRKYAVL